MEINNIHICNVCSSKSDENPGAVYVQAYKGNELIHICTACIPHVIHGSGEVVKPNADLATENLS